MKCLLILLAVGLVTSDKLDRTYLPPPGAKSAGGSLGDLQTPLELPSESYSEIPNVYFKSGYYQGTDEYPDSFSMKKNQALKGNKASPESFPQRVQENSDFIPNGYPNYQSNGQLFGSKMAFAPKIATSNDIAPNYQPNAFGYYGGGPMIMASGPPQPPQYPGSYQQIITMTVRENQGSNILPTSSEPPITDINRNNFSSSGPSDSVDVSLLTKIVTSNLFPDENKISNAKLPLQTSSISKTMTPVRFKPKRLREQFDRTSTIIKYENAITPEGFSYSFDTSNGIHADETGTAINGVRAKGSYSYTGDDGNVYRITYTADENGFRPVGDHLPTPPPIPEAIKKAIEKANRERVANIKPDDGSYDENKYGHKKYQGAMDRYDYFDNENVNKMRGTRINTISQNNRFINPNKDISHKKQIKDRYNVMHKENGNELSTKQTFLSYPYTSITGHLIDNKGTRVHDIGYKSRMGQEYSANNKLEQNKYKENQNIMIQGSNKFPNLRYRAHNRNNIINIIPVDKYNNTKSNVPGSPNDVENSDNLDAYIYVPPTTVFEENMPFIGFNRNENYKSDTRMPSNGDTAMAKEYFDLNGHNKNYKDVHTIISYPGTNNESTLENVDSTSSAYTTFPPINMQQFQHNTVFPNQLFDSSTHTPQSEKFTPNYINPSSLYQSINNFDQGVKVDGFGRPLSFDSNQEYPKSVTIDNNGVFTTKSEHNSQPSEVFVANKEPTKSQVQEDYKNYNLRNPSTSIKQFKQNKDFIEEEKGGTLNTLQNSTKPVKYSVQNDFPSQSSIQKAKPNYSIEDSVVIGEDFSGPKRAPYFDPANGYYY